MKALYLLCFFIAGCGDPYASVSYLINDFVYEGYNGEHNGVVVRADTSFKNYSTKSSFNNTLFRPRFSINMVDKYWIKDVQKLSLVQIYDKDLLSHKKEISPREVHLVLLTTLKDKHDRWIDKKLQSIPIQVSCDSSPKIEFNDEGGFSVRQPGGRCFFRASNAVLSLENEGQCSFDFYGYYDRDEKNHTIQVVIENIAVSEAKYL